MVDDSRICPQCGSGKAFPASLYDGFEVGVYCHSCGTLTVGQEVDVAAPDGEE